MTPRPPGAIQLAGGEGELRIRVGNYRIFYDIEDDALVVLVLPTAATSTSNSAPPTQASGDALPASATPGERPT